MWVQSPQIPLRESMRSIYAASIASIVKSGSSKTWGFVGLETGTMGIRTNSIEARLHKY